MNGIIMLSCLLVASAVIASAEVPVHLCGRQLAEARLLVCYGEKTDRKRNFPESFRDLFGEDNLITEDWPLKGKRAIFNAALLRYKKVGLAEECCIKACTTDVIRNYC